MNTNDRPPPCKSGLVIALATIICWALLCASYEIITIVVNNVIAAVE